MGTKRPKSKRIEQKGIIRFLDFINSECNFNEIDTKNDVGIDGYLEIFKNETATGCCIAIQIKSGNSYFKNKKFILQSDANHFKYWSSHLLPVIVVGYYPEQDKVFWFDVTEYLTNNLNIINDGPYTITFDLDNGDMNELISYCTEKYKKENTLKLLIRIMNVISAYKNKSSYEELVSSVKYLFNNYRNEIFVVTLILSVFQNTDDTKLILLTLSMLSYYVGNEDVFWHKENLINEDTSEYVTKNILSNLTLNDIAKILALLDNRGGYTRGGIGQIVFHFISINKNKVNILKDICFEINCPYIVKYFAFYALIFILQNKDIALTLSIIENFYESYKSIDEDDMIKSIYNIVKSGKKIEIY